MHPTAECVAGTYSAIVDQRALLVRFRALATSKKMVGYSEITGANRVRQDASSREGEAATSGPVAWLARDGHGAAGGRDGRGGGEGRGLACHSLLLFYITSRAWIVHAADLRNATTGPSGFVRVARSVRKFSGGFDT